MRAVQVFVQLWRGSASVRAGISTGVGAFATAVAFITDFAGLQELVCRQPVAAPICRWVHGLGRDPSEITRDETAWSKATASGDCKAFQQYRDELGTRGDHFSEVAEILLLKHSEAREAWDPKQKVTIATGSSHNASSKADAKAEALADARGSSFCQAFATGSFRLETTDFKARTWDCDSSGREHFCTVSGDLICRYRERRIEMVERCSPPKN